MTRFTLARAAQIIAVSGLILMTSSAGAQSEPPAHATQPMPCPMMQSPTGSGMMGTMGSGMAGQGGGMMKQMREEMQALHQEIVKLREELEKRDRR